MLTLICCFRRFSQEHHRRRRIRLGRRPIESIKCCTPTPKISKRNWTLNSDLGLTDGNPNPIRWFANLSLVGNGLIRSRENDTVGIGYYHLDISNLPIFTIHNVGDEDGVELFYNAAVTPWFHVTPDVQILDPADSPHRDGPARRHQGQAFVLIDAGA